MPTTITVTVFDNAESWLRKNVPNMASDSVCAVQPTTRFNPRGMTTYEDREEGTTKKCSFDDHVRALQQLSDIVGRTLFVGGVNGPHDLLDPGNWDAEVVDAYWQLVFYGKVIYG